MSYLRARSVRLLSLPICLASASFILGADEPTFSEQQKIDFMQNAKVIKSKERCSARKGVTTTWLLTLNDGTVTYDACFQPVDESKTVMQFADGRAEIDFKDSWKFNIAGYRVAKMIGLEYMVPVYTEREWKGRPGSMSWWVPNVMFDEADRLKKGERPPDVDDFNKQMYRIRILTQLFYDTDTNLTNVLITKDWKLWRIDFSRAFRSHKDLLNPKDLVMCDRQVLAKLKGLNFDEVFNATNPYLSKDQVKGLMARRDKIVEIFEKLVAQKGDNEVLY
ncbi:MAG TPA: hypothetical protein VN843_27530 [Anaerolineales bacterium]|jgi:hypothetical protein|nr:hypothetical protein [Anaerolineales bacterium]